MPSPMANPSQSSRARSPVPHAARRPSPPHVPQLRGCAFRDAMNPKFSRDHGLQETRGGPVIGISGDVALLLELALDMPATFRTGPKLITRRRA